MRKSSLFWLLLSVGGPAVAGDKPLYLSAPDWVTPAPPIDRSKLGDDAPLFVTLDNQERLADGTVWSYRDVATMLATPEVVAQAGTLTLDWAPAKGDLTIHRVEIIRGSSRIDALAGGKQFTVIRREQQLDRMAIDGQLTATLAVEGLQVGDILRLVATVSRKETSLAGGVQDVLGLPSAPIRVGFARTRVIWPAAADIKYKIGVETAAAKLVTSGDQRELTVTGVLPTPTELPDDAPLRFRKLPLLEVSSFADWQAVSRVMAPYYAVGGGIAPGGALAREVAAIAAAHSDPLKRADAALELVQGKVRYLFNGLDNGNYVPQTPEQTWTLRYGDCKAKTLLLLAVLHALDVPAEAVLANSRLGDALPARLPSAAAFDHVLVRATVADQDYWLDGTGAGTRLADLADVPPFGWVLPLRTAGAGLMEMPKRAPARAQAEVAVELDQRAGVLLPGLVHLTITLRGQPAAMIGLAKTQGSKAQKDQAVQQMVGNAIGGDAAVTGYTLSYDPVEARATIDATATATTLWQRTDNRYRLTLDRTVNDLRFEPDRARAEWRDLPVTTGAPGAFQVSMRVLLPGDGQGYTLDGDVAVPAPLASATIRRTVRQAGATVAVDDAVSATGAEVAAGDVASMRAKVALAKSRLLALVAPADLPPRWTAVRQARAAGALKPIQAAYTAAIARDPADVAGYDNRAAFLIGVYDWKAALPDLDKAVALAPTTERLLRRADVLMVTGADAKALADLQAARTLQPNEVGTLAALGTYLVDHGQKDAALTMLQERIDAGGTAKAQMMAGKADLLARAGDRDAALAVIDQAVLLKRGDAELLNQRCWLKARLNVQLDTALKDCTRSIELSDDGSAALDSRALVYLRLGRMDDALADLDAVLEQNPNWAASLYLRGIVYTRQGKMTEAARDLGAATFISPLIATGYKPFGIAP